MKKYFLSIYSVLPAHIIIFLIFAVIALFFIITGYGTIHDAAQWQGIYHYFYSSLAKGILPFWNPYSQTGTPFYQYYQAYGLLDPSNFLLVLAQKIINCSTWHLYILHYLFLYFVFISGTYNLLRIITKDNKTSLFFSIVLLMSSFSCAMRTGFLVGYFSIPFLTYLILKFSKEPDNNKKGFYLLVTSYLLAVSLNYYVPSIVAFYLLLLIVLLFLLKIINLKSQLDFFKSKTGLLWTGISLFILFCIIAPSIVIYFDSKDLFPSIRVLQKNGNHIARLFASDLNVNFLSEDFTNLGKVSITLGNLFGLVFDPVRFVFFKMYSEIALYVGILPLVFIVFALIKFKDKYAYVFSIISFVTLFVMTGFNNAIVATSSLNQRIISFVLFFLKPFETYQSFGVLFIFCLIVASAIGFTRLQEKSKLNVIYFALGILVFKYITVIFALDILLSAFLVVLMLIILFILSVFLIIDKKNYRDFKNILLAVVILDLMLWNAINYIVYDRFISKEYSSVLKKEGIFRSKSEEKVFENFRKPISLEGARPLIAFYGDEIYKAKKTALPVALAKMLVPYQLPRWDSFFMSDYYYDYIANIDIEKQPIISGISSPILRFIPEENAVFLNDKYEVVKKINDSGIDDLRKTIFIEKNIDSNRKTVKIGEFFNPKNYLAVSKDKIADFFNNSIIQSESYENAALVEDYNVNMLKVKLAPVKDGYFYFGDGYNKYWEAYIDGNKVKIEKANINFKAIHVSRGLHTIKFIYNPKYFIFAVYLYFLGSLCVLAICLFKLSGKMHLLHIKRS